MKSDSFLHFKELISVCSKKRESILFKKMFPRGSKVGVAFIYRDSLRVASMWLEEELPFLLSWRDLTSVSERNCSRSSNQPCFFLTPSTFSQVSLLCVDH